VFELEIQDLVYLDRDNLALGARAYVPVGDGPFPTVVDAHGGSWVKGKCANNDPINRRIAQGGVMVLAVDYSLPPHGTYPSSVADINFAVRWLKLNAKKFRTSADLVGVMGTSAGGHLAVLAAMKPFDPRYCSIALSGGEAIDATAAHVVTMWPVICPATCYEENLERQAKGDKSLEHRVGAGFAQMKYWGDKEAMVDGSPVLALERGDSVATPDILYIQAWCDTLHTKENMDRFCLAYTSAGGNVETEMLDGEPYDALRSAPETPQARKAFERISVFLNGARESTE